MNFTRVNGTYQCMNEINNVISNLSQCQEWQIIISIFWYMYMYFDKPSI